MEIVEIKLAFPVDIATDVGRIDITLSSFYQPPKIFASKKKLHPSFPNAHSKTSYICHAKTFKQDNDIF